MPSAGYNLQGERRTGRVRIRNRLFFGAVVEVQLERLDGTTEWVRCATPTEIRDPVPRGTSDRRRP